VPTIHPLRSPALWLKDSASQPLSETRLLLSLQEGSLPVLQAAGSAQTEQAAVWFLSGPEGGLSQSEEALAMAAGFSAASLGPRVLRAETAALTALALLTQSAAARPT
jgi:16S rRNA (uracil1498-N3)-methyltransferase